MDIPLLGNVRFLASREHIVPTSRYILRNPWRLHRERVEADFLDRKGVYCFWFEAGHPLVAGHSLDTSHLGAAYDARPRFPLDHALTPLYVGMTALAAYKKGTLLLGRIVDRLNRFPKVFQEYKVHDRFVLAKKKTGTCGSFDLFRFPERIARDLSARRGNAVTVEDAERILLDHPDVISKYAKEYKNIFYTTYAFSFLPISDEAEMFYTEALAIGLLRPWLNHS